MRILIKAKLLSSAPSSDSQRSLKSDVAKGDNYKVKAITILLESKIYQKISSFPLLKRVKKCFAFLSQNEYFSFYLET